MRLNRSFQLMGYLLFIGIIAACSGAGFQAGGGTKPGDPKKPGEFEADDPDPENEDDEENGNAVTDRTGLDIEDDDAELGLTAPLMVYYEGDNSGSDAQFTFYIARTSPVKDAKEVEIIKSQRKQFFSRAHKGKCICGQKNEMLFLWKHVRGRAGALHARNEGEWIVDRNPSDDGWKTKGLKTVPTGAHTIFLGADTENPDFLTDPTGKGYLRTATYSPNSPFSTKHSWGNRDDMKLALSCDLTKCPADLRSGTEIELTRDPSMNP